MGYTKYKYKTDCEHHRATECVSDDTGRSYKGDSCILRHEKCSKCADYKPCKQCTACGCLFGSDHIHFEGTQRGSLLLCEHCLLSYDINHGYLYVETVNKCRCISHKICFKGELLRLKHRKALALLDELDIKGVKIGWIKMDLYKLLREGLTTNYKLFKEEG